ncbi:hypothetical protein RHSIM_Rhsim11G0078200 [Rhododendron simsii]|uniref:Uncharacterized protein n=1 Tax=Rhododendron simsii TaxID=118357 RepID=A0A834L8X2_RHOSS|nr:hypothetical protein RHSIM_Rhsim11G0078200 [Rhododendron simsii]
MVESGAFGGTAGVMELVKKYEMAAAGTTTRSKRTSTVSQKEESDRDPSIYVRASMGYRTLGWFLIKIGGGPPAHDINLSPVFTEQAPVFRPFSRCEAMGSTIYSIGGGDPNDPDERSPERVSDVYWIDTLRPKQGWNKLDRSMTYPRAYTHGVAVDGNLYVMGSFKSSIDHLRDPPVTRSLKPEVYMESVGVEGFWRVLRDPPTDLFGDIVDVPHLINGHAVVDLGNCDNGGEKKRIVIMRSSGSTKLYSYDVDTDSWSVYHNDFPPRTFASAFVDGILYYLDYAHPGVMYGLDLSKPNQRVVVIGKNHKGNGRHPWMPPALSTPFLVSLGSGKLAALWEAEGDVPRHMRVYCSVIEVSAFAAYPLSCSSYCLRGSMIHECLAV